MASTYHVGRPGRTAESKAVRQSSLRSLNLATVLQAVYAASDAPSRADVATVTGLTRSTVSRLVDELITSGLIRELDPVVGGQRGRPAVPLVAPAGTWVGLGLEINVRHISVRCVDLAGTILGSVRIERDLKDSNPDAVLAEVGELARGVLAMAPDGVTLAGVKVALPGLVDAESGVLLRAPNLGWWDVKPAALLKAALGAPTVLLGVSNEADCAAVPIAWSSPGRPSGKSDFLYVSGEVGIGSALVTGSEIKTGRHGWAGEIGHVCVDADGPACGCGARGCLEQYVGQQALLAATGASDTAELVRRLEGGDQRAREVVMSAGRHLGVVLAGALNLLDISHVVLGGHLGQLADHLVPTVLDELATRVIAAPFEAPTVTTIVDDIDLAALGAAYQALFDVVADPASWMVMSAPE